MLCDSEVDAQGNPATGELDIQQSDGSQGGSSGVITPRGRRDPSPAELGLLKSRSIEVQVQSLKALVTCSHNLRVWSSGRAELLSIDSPVKLVPSTTVQTHCP